MFLDQAEHYAAKYLTKLKLINQCITNSKCGDKQVFIYLSKIDDDSVDRERQG